MDVLLSLTTHSGTSLGDADSADDADKLTRNAAIMTVKQWVPEVMPLSRKVVSFALSLLARLEIAPLPVEKIEKMEEDDVKPADEPAAVAVPPTVVAVYPVVKDGLVESGLPTPTTLSGVVQHIELYLALCAKTPDLLDQCVSFLLQLFADALHSLFESYTRLQPFAQQSVQTLITPLIRSLGAAHAKIPPLIRSSPVGADALVLRVLMILATDGRPPPALVAIVKELAEERPLSSKFYVMLMPDANKVRPCYHQAPLTLAVGDSQVPPASDRAAQRHARGEGDCPHRVRAGHGAPGAVVRRVDGLERLPCPTAGSVDAC